MRPLLDIHAKEGKDKKVSFDAGFTKPNAKCKWFFRKDVSPSIYIPIYVVYKKINIKFPEFQKYRNSSLAPNISSRMRLIATS